MRINLYFVLKITFVFVCGVFWVVFFVLVSFVFLFFVWGVFVLCL